MKKPGIALIAAGMLALLAVTGAVLPSKAHASVATPLRHVVVLLQEIIVSTQNWGFGVRSTPAAAPCANPDYTDSTATSNIGSILAFIG